MVRAAISSSAIALAALAGCASEAPVQPATAPVLVAQPTPTAIRPGFGRIESISAAPQSAAAGGATMRRLGIKMDDGTVQYVDTTAQEVYVTGDRIELTGDGHIRNR